MTTSDKLTSFLEKYIARNSPQTGRPNAQKKVIKTVNRAFVARLLMALPMAQPGEIFQALEFLELGAFIPLAGDVRCHPRERGPSC